MFLPSLRKLFGVELVEVTATEKLIAATGGGLSMLALAGIALWALPAADATAIVASMAASAVLLFAVPHGPLSQPWPVIAGHVVSATIGVACARFIPHPYIAAACAVGLAIGAMHQLKCIHPPGGATAFTAVMGGEAIRHLGFGFVLFPILANAVVMVLLAIAINGAFKWRRYPAVLNSSMRRTPRPDAGSPTHGEIVEALRSLDSFVDISEEDLLRLMDLLSRRTRR